MTCWSGFFCYIFRYTWIGLNDLKNESDYQWSDGANLTYKSMSPQADYMKDERADQEMDCIASDQNGQWTNFHCDDKFYSLCKKKLSKYINYIFQICTGNNYLRLMSNFWWRSVKWMRLGKVRIRPSYLLSAGGETIRHFFFQSRHCTFETTTIKT